MVEVEDPEETDLVAIEGKEVMVEAVGDDLKEANGPAHNLPIRYTALPPLLPALL